MAATPPISEAVALLRAGQVIGLPTETVYGLAGDALQPEAVAKIFAIKNRPTFDPLILHVLDIAGTEPYVTDWPGPARLLAEKFWPGPLTLVLPKQSIVPDLVTSGLSFVAVRAPAHPIARELLAAYGRPLAAPSANRFASISPTTADAVRQELGAAVPLILDGGPCPVGVESTIVAFPDGKPTLLRAGGVPLEEIEALIGPLDLNPKIQVAVTAPGALARHYSPRTPLRLIHDPSEVPLAERGRVALLGWGKIETHGFAAVRNLSEQKSLTEAATRLFTFLRELDQLGVPQIAAMRVPEEGLGRAINDRLRRAAH